MSVLVDSSVWIKYFRGKDLHDGRLDWLIDEGLVHVNDLILSELLPFLIVQQQNGLAELMRDLPALPLEIDWPAIVEDQVVCLINGVNKVGIPDLIIAQNAKMHGVPLFSHDRHFHLMHNHVGLSLFQ